MVRVEWGPETERTMRADQRGQSTLDFALGISVFLIAVVFIFLFIPDLTGPFYTPGEDGDTIQSERTANHLVSTVLASDEDSSHTTTLDPACTEHFFAKTDPPDHCGFDDTTMYDSGKLQSTALGLDQRTAVQIELLYQNGTVRDEVGEAPPSSGNIAQWTRLVSVSGEPHKLLVRVW